MFSFIRNCQYIFQNDYTILHHQCMCDSVSLYPHQHLMSQCVIISYSGFNLHFPSD